MTWIVDIGLAIIAVIATLVSYYCYIKGIVIKSANEVIDEVEVDGKVGEEKFKEAVDIIMDKIPSIAKPFIKRSYVEIVVQQAFDKIKDFAMKQNK